MRNFHLGYKGIIKCLAFALAPTNGVDALGNDRDDYVAMLNLKAWQVERKADNPDKSYVNTALRNYARDIHRGKSTDVKFVGLNEKRFQKNENPEQGLVQNDLLRRLQLLITNEQWNLLVSYMENDCNGNCTWEALGKPGSRSGFYRRIRLLRKKCKKLLDGI